MVIESNIVETHVPCTHRDVLAYLYKIILQCLSVFCIEGRFYQQLHNVNCNPLLEGQGDFLIE